MQCLPPSTASPQLPVCFLSLYIGLYFLGFLYKWDHTVYTLLYLSYFTQIMLFKSTHAKVYIFHSFFCCCTFYHIYIPYLVYFSFIDENLDFFPQNYINVGFNNCVLIVIMITQCRNFQFLKPQGHRKFKIFNIFFATENYEW